MSGAAEAQRLSAARSAVEFGACGGLETGEAGPFGTRKRANIGRFQHGGNYHAHPSDDGKYGPAVRPSPEPYRRLVRGPSSKLKASTPAPAHSLQRDQTSHFGSLPARAEPLPHLTPGAVNFVERFSRWRSRSRPRTSRSSRLRGSPPPWVVLIGRGSARS